MPMPWAPDITVANVRDECAVITVGIRNDALVTAAIDGGKAFIESVLRRANYDTANPAVDLSVRDAALAFIVCRLLSSIYGSEDWSDETAGAFRSYLGRVRLFVDSDGNLVTLPNLAKVINPLVPLVIEPTQSTENWPWETSTDDVLE